METLTLEPIEKMNSALAQENVTEQVIAKLQSYLPLTINGIEDKTGYEAVRKARIECKNVRVLAEKVCKKGREAAIAEQRAWLAKEKEVVAQITEVESHLSAQEKEYEAEKERIRQEAIRKEEEARAEAERKEQARIQARAERLLAYGITGDYDTLKNTSDEAFEMLVAQAKADYEAEQERIRLEQEEAERVRKAEAERQAQERAAMEAERARLAEVARKQEEQVAKLRAQQEAIDAERRAIEAAKQREEEAARRAAEMEQARAEAAEKARKDAEAKAQREAAEKAEAERLAQLEAKRQEMLRPDKEKLNQLATEVLAMELPTVASKEADGVLAEVRGMQQRMADYIRKQAAKL